MSTVVPDVVFVSGPTYWNGSRHILMPFSCTNGRLELPGTSYPSGTVGLALGNGGASVRILGGSNLVTSIGPRLQAFIRNTVWDTNTISSTAPITVASPATVTRVQQLSSQYLAPTWDQKSYNVSLTAWNNANFIGDSAVFMFTKPLVLQTKTAAGANICITFQTSWDH